MSNYLEIDSKILENNLLLQNSSPDAEDFKNFLRSPENYARENASWKLLTPTAGFCVKTTDLSNKKVFVNVCKLDDIPEPRDVTESQLLELWQSEDVPDFRIPLSIQEPHEEFDKSGHPTVAYDVALNTKFFEKVQSNLVFRSFVMQVIFEGLENKYDIQLKKEGFVILQNRKSLGELRPHRIRKTKSPYSAPKPLIEELSSSPSPSGSGDRIEKKSSLSSPQCRLFENRHSKFLIGEFYLPNVATSKDLSLDVGENRIVLESRRGSYMLDFFVPIRVDERKAAALFNLNTKMLTLKMPIICSNYNL